MIIRVAIDVLVLWPLYGLQFLLAHPVIAAVAAVPAYMVLCLAHPVHKCPRCRGAKVIRKGSRHKRCRWCKGHGRTRRLGGQMFHRLVWDHAGPWIREKFDDVVDRLRDGAS